MTKWIRSWWLVSGATIGLALVAWAGELSCCQKACAAGKECTHPCCVEAKKEGKICPSCNKNLKDCCKTALQAGKLCEHCK
jgi:hypothetical protein